MNASFSLILDEVTEIGGKAIYSVSLIYDEKTCNIHCIIGCAQMLLAGFGRSGRAPRPERPKPTTFLVLPYNLFCG